ncbi:hypothetical protein [Luteibacter sp. CQ10]
MSRTARSNIAVAASVARPSDATPPHIVTRTGRLLARTPVRRTHA